MKRIILAAGTVSSGLLFLMSAAGAEGIKEGQWSMTTAIHMEGADTQSAKAMKEMENMSPEDKAMIQQMMGGMGVKMGAPGGGMGMTTTIKQCLTNDDPVPEANNEKNCKQTHTMRGNAVNFEVVCDNSRSTGEVTYNNGSMTGTIHSTSSEKGRPQNVTMDIRGEYIGPCDQK